MLSKRLRGSRIAGSPYKVYLIKLLFYLIKLPYGAKRLKENTSPKSDILHATTPKTYHSSSWKNIYMISWQLREAYFWILGNEKKINFWKDKWIVNTKIEDYVKSIQNLRVAELINWNTKTWNLSIVESCCPDYIIRKIAATLFHCINARINKNGRSPLQEIFFTLKSAYNWMSENNTPLTLETNLET